MTTLALSSLEFPQRLRSVPSAVLGEARPDRTRSHFRSWPSEEPCLQWTLTQEARAATAGSQVESILRQEP